MSACAHLCARYPRARVPKALSVIFGAVSHRAGDCRRCGAASSAGSSAGVTVFNAAAVMGACSGIHLGMEGIAVRCRGEAGASQTEYVSASLEASGRAGGTTAIFSVPCRAVCLFTYIRPVSMRPWRALTWTWSDAGIAAELRYRQLCRHVAVVTVPETSPEGGAGGRAAELLAVECRERGAVG